MRILPPAIAAMLTACMVTAAAPRPLPRLKVSENRRFLVQAGGRPFFYLGDTAWELFHRLDRKQAIQYLDKRAAQKYTVVQAVAIAELDGLMEPNAMGDLPFIGREPSKPAVTPGANPASPQQYDYWDHVEFIVDEANRRGIYIGFLPAWGRWVTDKKPGDMALTAKNAQTYGEFLGKRFGNKGIIWIMGGDRVVNGFEEVFRLLARGIAIGTAGKEDHDAVTMTFHPRGGATSSTLFHNDAWLDFNMHQTGHGLADKTQCWARIAADYALTPVKPVMDGEPLYEDHPLAFRAREFGYSFDAHVRQRAYWNLFSGAFGHTYGNHSVWQMYAPGRKPVNGPLYYWYEAVHRPGADQMRHARALIESRPFLSRVPDPSVVAAPLDGADYIAATRGDGYVFIYSAQGRPFTVQPGKMPGERVKAWWYNPRTGASEAIEIDHRGGREFTPPSQGFGADWVLVLDDAARKFPPPGAGTVD